MFQPGVRCFVELRDLRAMTGATAVIADKVIGRRWWA
jgi:hypothetical protein